MTLRLTGVGVDLDGRRVLDAVSFDAAGAVALLGPSGSGKTTILRAIAGLVPLAEGEIHLDGARLDTTPVHRRHVAMMFQDHALLPHRDVGANVEFGLRMQGVAATARRARVGELLDLVGLPGFERRAVHSLSGGEQQRVALARALAPTPRVVLLDEPFASLDRDLRARLVDDVRAILSHLAIPAVVVTHDHAEAFALADQVAVLRDGRVVQEASPEVLWHAPADEWTARFVGHQPIGAGMLVRADALTIQADGDRAGVVTDRAFADGTWHVTVQVEGWSPVRVRSTTRLEVGEPVRLRLDERAMLRYPTSSADAVVPVPPAVNAQ